MFVVHEQVSTASRCEVTPPLHGFGHVPAGLQLHLRGGRLTASARRKHRGNHGRTMGKPRENPRKMMKTIGTPWENPRKMMKTIGTPWENGGFMGKPWENHGKVVVSCDFLWHLSSGYVNIAIEN